MREDVETWEKPWFLCLKLKLVDYDVEWASREPGNPLLMSWAFYLGGEEEL